MMDRWLTSQSRTVRAALARAGRCRRRCPWNRCGRTTDRPVARVNLWPGGDQRDFRVGPQVGLVEIEQGIADDGRRDGCTCPRPAPSLPRFPWAPVSRPGPARCRGHLDLAGGLPSGNTPERLAARAIMAARARDATMRRRGFIGTPWWLTKGFSPSIRPSRSEAKISDGDHKLKAPKNCEQDGIVEMSLT